MYGSQAEIQRIQSKLREIGKGSPHRSSSKGTHAEASHSRAGATLVTVSSEQPESVSQRSQYAKPDEQQLNQAAVASDQSSTVRGSGRVSLPEEFVNRLELSDDPWSSAPIAAPRPSNPVVTNSAVNGQVSQKVEPSDMSVSVPPVPPARQSVPRPDAQTLQRYPQSTGSPKTFVPTHELYASKAGKEARLAMAKAVPTVVHHRGMTKEPGIAPYGASPLPDYDATEQANHLAKQLRQQQFSAVGPHDHSAVTAAQNNARQSQVQSFGVRGLLNHFKTRILGGDSAQMLHREGYTAVQSFSELGVTMGDYGVNGAPSSQAQTGPFHHSVSSPLVGKAMVRKPAPRFLIQDGVIWLIGSVMMRVGIDVLLIAFPSLWLPITAIVLTPVALALYQAAMNPQPSVHSGRRLLVVMVGLLIGGQLL